MITSIAQRYAQKHHPPEYIQKKKISTKNRSTNRFYLYIIKLTILLQNLHPHPSLPSLPSHHLDTVKLITNKTNKVSGKSFILYDHITAYTANTPSINAKFKPFKVQIRNQGHCFHKQFVFVSGRQRNSMTMIGSA